MSAPKRALEDGALVGPYRITGTLGAGGMGEVYLARDERLARDVALKVLPAGLAHDPERLERLNREARATGGLNHPNVVVIHDVGTHQGSTYLVMERLVGRDLRSLLGTGRTLPVRQTIEIGRQVAAGLFAAHERGIVHRDLKPENLFVTEEGVVKILDFGLARRQSPAAAGARADSLDASELTSTGMLMGTAGYMSPEQVLGEPVDARSDIFAFGAILYEMLTGRRAFAGKSGLETLNAIVEGELPAPSAAEPRVPPALDAIVRHCLEKEPRRRYQSAADLEYHLASALEMVRSVPETADPGAARGDSPAAPSRPRALPWRPAVALVVLGMALGALLSAWVGSVRPGGGARGLAGRGTRPTGPGPSLTFLPGSGTDFTPSISPDGRLLAFGTERDGVVGLWLRRLDDGSETPLTRGDDYAPGFSPDGQQILFSRGAASGTSLWRVATVGGDARKLISNAEGGIYAPDGAGIACVLYSDSAGARVAYLTLASPDGTNLRRLATFEDREVSAIAWSPDGTEVAVATSRGQSIALQDVITRIAIRDGRRQETRLPAGFVSQFGGLLWTGRNRILIGNNDDLNGCSARLLAVDTETAAVDTLFRVPCTVDWLSRSRAGDIVIGSRLTFSNLRAFDLDTGDPSAPSTALSRGPVTDRQPIVSPDGQWIYYASTRSGNQDIWRMSMADSRIERITDHPTDDWDPALSPDGRTLVWSSRRAGQFDIWMADAEGGGARQVTRDLAPAENPTFTAGGEWIVFTSADPAAPGIYRVRPDGTGAVRIVAGDQRTPDVSPDGTWVASRTPTEGGQRVTVYAVADGAPSGFQFDVKRVRPGVGNLARVRWHPGGREILFSAQSETGPQEGIYSHPFAPGRPPAAPARPLALSSTEQPYATFAITPDGRRLILSRMQLQESVMLLTGLEAGR